MKKCPKCGKEIANDSVFCEYCGVKLNETNNRKWIWITLTIILFIVFAWLGLLIADDNGFFESDAVYYEEAGDTTTVFGDYIDLGLPSGTLWKDVNESDDFYDYDTAMELFGDNLPTKEQLEELKDECTWSWTGSGYEVTGKNGNSICLPAAGFRYCNGDVHDVGSWGHYWSSTPNGSENAWYLNFYSDKVYMNYSNRCIGQSVRLVQD